MVIARLDAPRADYAGTLAECQRLFGGLDGENALPLYVPVGGSAGEAPHGLVGLLSRTGLDYGAGYPPKESQDLLASVDVDTERAALIEGIINNSEDETLLERYLNGEEIDLEVATGIADRFRRLQRASAEKHRESAKQFSLGIIQEIVTPINGLAESLLPFGQVERTPV